MRMMKEMSTRQIMVRRQNSALQKITKVKKEKSLTKILKGMRIVQLKGMAHLRRMRKSPKRMMKEMSTRQIMVRRQNSALQKITNVNKKKSPT